MIEVKNKTLFEWSIESLPINISKKIIFICLEGHENDFKVSEFIKKIMILITGSNGWLGSNLIKLILENLWIKII